ncbi:MAG TPA: xanthine dehydrogenase family protein subunit M [Acidimicrobiales bacterium]|nr:xanthine dehydrogenase family protein subunit M [Acidimicrobiales bacterium]
MKPAAFTYHRAESVEHAVSLLGELGEDAKVIAGGQSLVALMNMRLARPSALVDVSGVRGLHHMVLEPSGELRIGALVTHAAIEDYPLVIPGFEILPKAAALVGHWPIRTRGTFGGSIAHADPTSEWCLVAVLHGARMVIEGPGGSRTLGSEDFFGGPFMTDLGHDELLTEVVLTEPRERSAIREFARRAGDFAIVSAAVAYDIVNGRMSGARVALGGVASVAVRAPAAEAELEGAEATPEVFARASRAAAEDLQPPSDLHGSADYRRRLVRVLTERALADTLAGD